MLHRIFIPGSFSPFHDGHYKMIENFLFNDNAEIIIIMSEKKRDDIDNSVITDLLNKIFSKYDNVKIIKSDISPIKWIYENTIEDENVIYSMIRSNKNADDRICEAYANSFSVNGKFHSDKIFVEKINLKIEPLKFNNGEFISGTILRDSAKNKNFIKFREGYEYMLMNNILSLDDVNNVYRTIF